MKISGQDLAKIQPYENHENESRNEVLHKASNWVHCCTLRHASERKLGSTTGRRILHVGGTYSSSILPGYLFVQASSNSRGTNLLTTTVLDEAFTSS